MDNKQIMAGGKRIFRIIQGVQKSHMVDVLKVLKLVASQKV